MNKPGHRMVDHTDRKLFCGSYYIVFWLLISSIFSSCLSERKQNSDWPGNSAVEKPWTRWWWMGNILDEENITLQLEAFADAGLGGIEITPIYGVKGYEDVFLDHLSPRWNEMLEHTISEAERLGLGVDMILGTGWPYGGPQVEAEFAASKMHIRQYHLKAEETFSEKILLEDPKLSELAELQHFIFYDEGGRMVDITSMLTGGKISYTPEVDKELYAVFSVKTRQKVKRAAPGGEGFTFDHFSSAAFKDYTKPYDEALLPVSNRLRAIFNDSYEVYQADFTPEFLREFQERRNYDLLDHIPILHKKERTDIYSRVICDYRETLADLLLEEFVFNWDSWCEKYAFSTKYQAHGSPGNLIDLYAAADIPECEIFGSPSYDIPGYRRDTLNIRKGDSNKMMLKFCSSAAHLKGNELVSSETFTWLREHFKTALSHCKPLVDDLFLSGVNHIFLHGSTYSPKEDPWPGFKFYAAVNFNPTNTIWKDAPYLFEYITRCQSILQHAVSDNEVLLYWPIHDAYTSSSPEQLLHQFSIHSIDDWLIPGSFYKLACDLDKLGVGFDFISDRFISECEVSNLHILVSGKVEYRTLLVPDVDVIPIATLQKLIDLKRGGAKVIFMGKPESVPGYFQFEQREDQLFEMVERNLELFSPKEDIETLLDNCGIVGEQAVKLGLKMIRKKLKGSTIYFLANHGDKSIDQYVTFNTVAESALIMDPLSGKTGSAKIRPGTGSSEVRVQLLPGETLFLKMNAQAINTKPWNYLVQHSDAISLDSGWEVSFIEGGPVLPGNILMDKLQPWTNFGTEYEAFSGTAKYSTIFEMQELTADYYSLDLGDVRESARVYLNGDLAGCRFAHPFRIDISDLIQEGNNSLEIEVTNLSANRLRAIEISGAAWKKFYEINMVNIHYQPFDATMWDIEAAGLNGDVRLLPQSYSNF